MRQCTVEPAWIGHALKRRPYWVGQTRLIPSLFYMLSFHAFLKQKSVKRTLLQTDKIFSPQLKNTLPYADTKISGISEKQRINLDILSIFAKRNIFLQFKTTFFNFNLQFWRSATLLTQTRYILYQVALCDQPTIVFAPLKAILTFKPYCIPLWTIAFSTVTYIKLWWSVKDLKKNALKS